MIVFKNTIQIDKPIGNLFDFDLCMKPISGVCDIIFSNPKCLVYINLSVKRNVIYQRVISVAIHTPPPSPATQIRNGGTPNNISYASRIKEIWCDT